MEIITSPTRPGPIRPVTLPCLPTIRPSRSREPGLDPRARMKGTADSASGDRHSPVQLGPAPPALAPDHLPSPRASCGSPGFPVSGSPGCTGRPARAATGRRPPLEAGMVVVEVLLGVLGFAAVWGVSGLRVVRQYERGVVFRLGRVQPKVRQAGLTRIVPVVDRLRRVNMQIVTMPVPAQEGITRDNVTVRVDAVVYFRVEDPVTAIVAVQDYKFAVGQVAQ